MIVGDEYTCNSTYFVPGGTRFFFRAYKELTRGQRHTIRHRRVICLQPLSYDLGRIRHVSDSPLDCFDRIVLVGFDLRPFVEHSPGNFALFDVPDLKSQNEAPTRFFGFFDRFSNGFALRVCILIHLPKHDDLSVFAFAHRSAKLVSLPESEPVWRRHIWLPTAGRSSSPDRPSSIQGCARSGRAPWSTPENHALLKQVDDLLSHNFVGVHCRSGPFRRPLPRKRGGAIQGRCDKRHERGTSTCQARGTGRSNYVPSIR